jgi:hypothetical protein
MLILHTRLQQTYNVLGCNILVCYTCSPEVCDRALKKKSHKLKNRTVFCFLIICATASFWQNDALQVKHWSLDYYHCPLVTISTRAWVRQGKTTRCKTQTEPAGRVFLDCFDTGQQGHLSMILYSIILHVEGQEIKKCYFSHFSFHKFLYVCFLFFHFVNIYRKTNPHPIFYTSDT